MPRYVLLRHECETIRNGSHWDLMLERDGVLKAWALEELPAPWADALEIESAESREVTAARLPDHRIRYLEHEGPISRDRGSVRRAADGDFDWKRFEPFVCEVQITGGKLLGRVEMTCQTEGVGSWRIRVD